MRRQEGTRREQCWDGRKELSLPMTREMGCDAGLGRLAGRALFRLLAHIGLAEGVHSTSFPGPGPAKPVLD